jgi:hypothetical protein
MGERTMPAGFDGVFRGFFQEFSILKLKWELYQQLFKDRATIDLLNRHASLGFGVTQDVLFKDVILCIMRMMNPQRESWGDVANLATLIIDVSADKQTALAARLRGIRDGIKPVSDELRVWRDKQLARNDYATFVDLKAGIDALPPRSRQMIDDVLSALGEVLLEVQAHYTGAEELHKEVTHAHAGDFDQLVSHLRDLELRTANDPG